MISPPTSSFSYDKLPQLPIVLNVRKLDGSSFDVEVSKTAAVGELKYAVEDVFRHMPREGPDKISWSHVWGHFCLCYDQWKLISDNEPISSFGISEGDQLHFVRHASNIDNLIRRRSKDKLSASEQPRIISGSTQAEKNEEKDESSDECSDDESSHDLRIDEDIIKRYESKLSQLFSGLFSYHRVGSPEKKSGSNLFLSRVKGSSLGSFINMARILSSNKFDHHRDPLEEV